MTASELVLEILANLGFLARDENGAWVAAEEMVDPSPDLRNQQWGLLKTLLREVPEQCDAWMLGVYCGADRTVGLERMYERRSTFGNLLPDQGAIMASIGNDATIQQEQLVRVPFLPKPENALWSRPFSWSGQSAMGVALLYACHHLATTRDVDAFADFYETHIAPEEGPEGNLSVEGCLHISYGRWEEALSTYARLARDRALHESEKLLQTVAAAGMKQFGSSRELLAEIDTGALDGAGVRLFRVLEVMVLEAEANDEYTRGQARAAREKVRVTEADSPEVLSLLARSKIELPRGSTGDIDLRETPKDPWSRLRDDERKRQAAFQEAMSEIDDLVGLEDLRRHIQAFVKQLRIAQAREEQGLATQSSTGHWVFAGPPGTGKTTVARIMAKLLFGLGKIDSDKVVEVRRADLVGQHLGETAPRTRKKVEEAFDGVLFIDEAYELQNNDGYSGSDAFGREAVAELLAMMENERERLVVIAAGYRDEMEQFLGANEGLRSRFNQRLDFTPYYPTELAEIVARMGRADDNTITEAALAWLASSFRQLDQEKINSLGNGRLARNVYHKLLKSRDSRLNDEMDHTTARGTWTLEELTTITDADARAAILDESLPFPPAEEEPLRTCIDVRDRMPSIATALVSMITKSINTVRIDAKLTPFQRDDDLERIAQFWLQDQMADFSRAPDQPLRLESIRLPEHITHWSNDYFVVECGPDIEAGNTKTVAAAIHTEIMRSDLSGTVVLPEQSRLGAGALIHGTYVIVIVLFGQREDSETTNSNSNNNEVSAQKRPSTDGDAPETDLDQPLGASLERHPGMMDKTHLVSKDVIDALFSR